MTTANDIAGILGGVVDPELGVDIVSLGLVYGIEVDGDRGAVHVSMTTTSPMCPMGAALVSAVAGALEYAFPGAVIDVEVTRDPEWSIGMIDEVTRVRLRIR